MKPVSIFLPLLCAGLLCASCGHQPKTAVAPSPPSQEGVADAVAIEAEASISATPNPVVHGPDEGQTTIAWDTHGSGSGAVYVSRNGAPEQLFASGRAGHQSVPWIKAGLKYDFLLYRASSHQLLAKVQVTHRR